MVQVFTMEEILGILAHIRSAVVIVEVRIVLTEGDTCESQDGFDFS